MNPTKRKIFKALSTERWSDSSIFFLRLFVGVMMLVHGIQKINNYEMLHTTFPDPIGWGSQTSLLLITAIETIGSICLIVGFLVRPAALALAIGMFVATFLSAPGESFAQHELSFVYMGIYIALIISGGMRYSLDRMVFRVR